MPFSQRQIIEVPFNLPQGILHHPAIILSVNEAIEIEQAFVCAMITSSKFDDEFTFELTNHMLQSGKITQPYSEVRVHLISFFTVRDVIVNNHRNTFVKKDYFDRIIRRINRVTFGQI